MSAPYHGKALKNSLAMRLPASPGRQTVNSASTERMSALAIALLVAGLRQVARRRPNSCISQFILAIFHSTSRIQCEPSAEFEDQVNGDFDGHHLSGDQLSDLEQRRAYKES